MTAFKARFDLPAADSACATILISGWRTVGKTTTLLHIHAAAQANGLSTGGFLSVARMAAGKKVGIDLVDAARGQRLPLATLGEGGAVRTGHYSFNPAALEAGLSFARDGHEADVYFVDELGPLELVRGEGWAEVIPLIRARTRGVSLVVVRPELIAVAYEQIGLAADAPRVMIDAENQQAAAVSLAAWLLEWARAGR